MRRLSTVLLVILLVMALVPGWTGEARLPVLGGRANMTATRVVLDQTDRARTRLGGLTFLGGIELRSRDPAFGGFSSMAVQGDRFTLLSDGANIVRFRMGRDWRLHNLGFASLPDGPGNGWEKRDRDSESLALDPATGTAWVGYERYNAIWRYTPGLDYTNGQVRPGAMAEWPDNGGPEAMARLRDGRFVVIGERARLPRVAGVRPPGRRALVFAGDPVATREPVFDFVYIPPDGFDPADATQLPDGRLLILNRAFALPYSLSNSLVLVDPGGIRPGATIRGHEIARLAKPLIHDNFEGVAAAIEDGRTVIWIVSDDNESVLERTLLLKFRLNR